MAQTAAKSIETGPDDVSIFRTRLLAWYKAHGRRNLPWRNTTDPYAIYLSEIMLQQTQVETVLARFYFPFLERFPTLESLARASHEEVLKCWQGLGYYTRAGNLHKAAQQILEARGQRQEAGVKEAHPMCSHTHSCLLPLASCLLSLPGIGRNTAHAVAAFGFRLPVAVMEANVKRVLSRIFALERPDDKTLWAHAAALLDPAEPFDYNQAMMDIGALVCTRSKPRCGECPANHFCIGQAHPAAYPAPKAAKQERIRRKTITVLRNAKGHYHALPRTTRFLNGMYAFEEHDAGPPPADARLIGHVTQVYSHFTLDADVYLAHAEAPHDGHWFTLEALQALPHSKAEEKIIALLRGVER